MFYIYLLMDTVERQTYIGYTSDLRRRFVQHKDKKPTLVYYEAYQSEADARRREYALKRRGQTVRRLKERLADSFELCAR